MSLTVLSADEPRNSEYRHSVTVNSTTLYVSVFTVSEGICAVSELRFTLLDKFTLLKNPVIHSYTHISFTVSEILKTVLVITQLSLLWKSPVTTLVKRF